MKQRILLLLIILLGAFFRFYGLNWDQYQHLHPDERFLTMVGNAMKLPQTFTQYLDPQLSTYNPTNIGYSYFTYGTLPLIINKTIAILYSNDTYDNFTLQGRFLSGLVDILVIFLIFKTVSLFEKKYTLSPAIKYWASSFYAVSVLPIQLSHFFAVDTFLNLFMFASFYFALNYAINNRFTHLVMSAFFFGLALTSKITALSLAPLLIFLFLQISRFKKKEIQHAIKLRFLFSLLIFLLISYLVVRLADPYIFKNSNFLDPSLNETFVTNLQSLKSFEGKNTWYPPAIQWISKTPVIFSLTNLVLFGVGIPYFICILIGVVYLTIKKRNIIFIIMLFWTVSFFIYQSMQFVKVMRYFIFLYPFFAIFAGFGFYKLNNTLKRYTYKWYPILLVLCVGAVLVWPLAFFSIYTKEQSRVTASEWIYRYLPDNSIVLTEYWDDSLPLWVRNTSKKTFQNIQLPVFDPDTEQKWQKMNNYLSQGDYLILSSNRGWGSIPTVPERYPKMKKFYEDLFGNKLPYRRIAEFTSYPSLAYLGIPFEFSDDFADENFTVFDHPKVMIFKKI
jgi:hypothetical protein